MRLSLAGRIALVGGASLLVTATTLVAMGTVQAERARATAMAAAVEGARAEAGQRFSGGAAAAAAHLESLSEGALAQARALAQVLERTKAESDAIELGREQIVLLLRTALEGNPGFARAWVHAPPKGLDELDSIYAKTPGHDASGRFVACWSRDPAGKPVLAALKGYADAPAQNRALAGRERVVEPHPLPEDGARWVVSATVPVLVKGKAVAVVGIDLPASAFAEVLDEFARPLAGGSLALLADGRRLLASGQPPGPATAAAGDPLAAVPCPLGRGGDRWTVATWAPAEAVAGAVHTLEQQLVAAGRRELWMQLGLSALVAGAGITALLWLARSISRPVRATADRLRELAEGDGDLTARLDAGRRDELGDLARAFNALMDQLQELLRAVSASTTDLNTAAERLSTTARTMSAEAAETRQQADSASGASGRVKHDMGQVEAAVAQFRQSIAEIAGAAQASAGLAQRAVTDAEGAAGEVGRLDEASRAIGQVVTVIQGIAAKVNLLALNAAIEAASAGDAGRGFSVVANEVKELARQVAAASQDIAGRIAAIQAGSHQAAGALTGIAATIRKVNDGAGAIAAAVEQQSATAEGMVGQLRHATDGSSAITDSIAAVQGVAGNAAEGAARTESAAEQVSAIAIELQGQLSRYKL
jgi:methyl-accepting chemotaxis protein